VNATALTLRLVSGRDAERVSFRRDFIAAARAALAKRPPAVSAAAPKVAPKPAAAAESVDDVDGITYLDPYQGAGAWQ
jgi:hypothetical protein